MKENLRKIIEDFVNTKRSEFTKKAYKRHIIEFIEFKNIETLEEFRNMKITDYYAFRSHLLNSGISENSTRLRFSALSSFYNFLMRDDAYGIQKNIVSTSDLFENTKAIVNPEHTTWLTDDEAKSFLKACKNKRDLAICSVFLNTGLRVSELINLKLKDLKTETDPELGEISTILVRRKGGKMQEVYFNNFVTHNILNYLKVRKETSEPYLFISNHGNKMTTCCIDMTINKIAKKAKIDKRISAHSLRRTAATSMYNKGFRVDEIQGVLGHSNPKTTQIYLKGIENKSLEVFKRFEIC